jgi:hypothetical protein
MINELIVMNALNEVVFKNHEKCRRPIRHVRLIKTEPKNSQSIETEIYCNLFSLTAFCGELLVI